MSLPRYGKFSYTAPDDGHGYAILFKVQTLHLGDRWPIRNPFFSPRFIFSNLLKWLMWTHKSNHASTNGFVLLRLITARQKLSVNLVKIYIIYLRSHTRRPDALSPMDKTSHKVLNSITLCGIYDADQFLSNFDRTHLRAFNSLGKSAKQNTTILISVLFLFFFLSLLRRNDIFCDKYGDKNKQDQPIYLWESVRVTFCVTTLFATCAISRFELKW